LTSLTVSLTPQEFHHGGRYYKGKGKEFHEWLLDRYPSAFVMHLERAEGGRQDLAYDAAVPMYINRKYMVEFLHERLDIAGHTNVLEDFLYIAHTKDEFIAMTRANAIIDLLIARPMRWMAGNSCKMENWSPFSMGPVLDTVEELFERVARDGSVMLDPNLDVFKDVASTQPAYRDFLKYMYEEDTVLSPDCKTRFPQYRLARDELLSPADESNQRTRALTIQYLQVQAAAAITKLHDTRTVLPEYLTSQDGAKCWAKVAQAHADTKGTEASNDKFSESVFGVFDRMLKVFYGISREAASGLSQAVRAKSFWQGDAVQRRKQRDPPPPGIGYFHTLPVEEQEALVEYARRMVRESRKVDRQDNAEVAAYVKSKVRASSEDELKALITEWAYGMSFFERWQERGVRSVAQLTAGLRKLDATTTEPDDVRRSTQEKLDWLREQIEMRTRGLQWVDFKAKWSSSLDAHVGTVEELTAQVGSHNHNLSHRPYPLHVSRSTMAWTGGGECSGRAW
jgi:hypothetical protein